MRIFGSRWNGKSAYIEERITELLSYGRTILQVGPDVCDKCEMPKNYERKRGSKKEVDHRCKSAEKRIYQIDEIDQIPNVKAVMDMMGVSVGPDKNIKSR